MRADLVVNALARGHATDPALLERMRELVAGRARLHVTHCLEDLETACDAIANANSPLVILSGGDGTLMTGVTTLAARFGERMPAIAPLRSGTVGTVAKNWGATEAPLARLETILRGPRRLVRRPTLRVSAHDGADPQERVGFIFGTGLVASFFRVYEERGAPGYQGAARIAARVFVESFVAGPLARRILAPMPCELLVNGVTRSPDAWSLICASVVRDLGIGMRLTYRAGEDAARPHLVASPLPPNRLGPRAPRVLLGMTLGGAGLVDELVSSLEVRFDGRGSYVLDGELLAAERVVLRAGPVIDTV
jgi:diacylglycerol kinase (ATP)